MIAGTTSATGPVMAATEPIFTVSCAEAGAVASAPSITAPSEGLMRF
jgi:hypothetical protein